MNSHSIIFYPLCRLFWSLTGKCRKASCEKTFEIILKYRVRRCNTNVNIRKRSKRPFQIDLPSENMEEDEVLDNCILIHSTRLRGECTTSLFRLKTAMYTICFWKNANFFGRIDENQSEHGESLTLVHIYCSLSLLQIPDKSEITATLAKTFMSADLKGMKKR